MIKPVRSDQNEDDSFYEDDDNVACYEFYDYVYDRIYDDTCDVFDVFSPILLCVHKCTQKCAFMYKKCT